MFVGAGSTIGRIGVEGEGRVGHFGQVRRFGRGQTAAAFHGRLIIARTRGLSIKLFFLTKPH